MMTVAATGAVKPYESQRFVISTPPGSHGSTQTLWRTSALAALMLIVASCTTVEHVPELRAIAAAGRETPATVSGDLLEQCRSDVAAINLRIADPARYDPELTYSFSARMYNIHEKTRQFAKFLRVYSTETSGKGLFGPIKPIPFHCFYQLKDNQLMYLTYIYPSRDGRAPPSSILDVVLTSYAKMAGKNVGKVRMFGIFAD